MSSPMEKQKVVPDVLPKSPYGILEVTWPNGKADMGNELTPTDVKAPPKVQWETEENALYTLAMVDPDAPSNANPKFREWHHWLVVNIPGTSIDQGEVLSAYIGAGPPKNTGLHRYVLVVYKQPSKLTCSEPKLPNTSGDKRGKFSIKGFAKKYNLGDAIAANFFCAKFDDYVPTLYKQISGKL